MSKYIAIGNSEPTPDNLPDEIKKIINDDKRKAGFNPDGTPMTNTADTNQASELYELCKEVYERTEWQGDFLSNWGWVHAHGEYEVDNGCTDGLPPLYTSDYLLEKLEGFGYMDGPSKGVELMRDVHNGWGWLAHIPGYYYKYGGNKWVGFADTPLKALLKLTIALSEAGELDNDQSS